MREPKNEHQYIFFAHLLRGVIKRDKMFEENDLILPINI